MKGFYFGGSLIDKNSLRAAALYYDSVIHYDVAKFFKPFYGKSVDVTKAIDKFYKDTKAFVDEGILTFIPISAWIDKYGNLLSNTAKQYFFHSDTLLYEIANSMEANRLIVLHSFGKQTFPTPPQEFPENKRLGPFAYYSDSNAFQNVPSKYWGLPYKNFVTMAIGREVAYGLFGSVEFNAVPFTDLIIYSRCLDRLLYQLCISQEGIFSQSFPHPVLRQLENEKISKERISTIQELTTYNREYQSRVVQEAIRITVPAFQSLPDNEILEFRERRKDELISFRKTVDKIVADMQDVDLSKINEIELRLMINKKIQVQLSDLEKTLEEKVTEAKKKRIENATLTSISIAAFAFLPFEAVILPSILALGKWTTDEINGLIDRIKIKKNGLYVLWELGKLNKMG
jgi:hypothetical protein